MTIRIGVGPSRAALAFAGLFLLGSMAAERLRGQGLPLEKIARISVDSTGGQANGRSLAPMGFPLTAFHSEATNLVPGDTNAVGDVFVHRRSTGETRRVSVSATGEQGNGRSWEPDISEDLPQIVFSSIATNLVPGDTNGKQDIFAADYWTGEVRRLSVSQEGVEANDDCWAPAIDDFGIVVAFDSYASNLVPSDMGGVSDVFVTSPSATSIQRVSVATGGWPPGNGDSILAAVSSMGGLIAFESAASNLVADDTNGQWDVFVHNRGGGPTYRDSVSTAGAQATLGSFGASLAGDPEVELAYLAFVSSAGNLVAGDTNGKQDVFFRDHYAGTTIRVSVSSEGAQANGHSYAPATSYYLTAFESAATNLVAEDTNGVTDVFLHDRRTGQTSRISVDRHGNQGNGASAAPWVSWDARYVVFQSAASNLVDNDTNGVIDIFVVDTAVIFVDAFESGELCEWADAC